MSALKTALIVLFLIPFVADAALEKRVPCWPGFDFVVAPPYGDPQCQFNEAKDCGFPPPPLSVQPTQQDADKYTEIVQNQTRSQVTGEAQRTAWQGTGQGSPSPCQASTKSTYNVARVKQNQAAGKCKIPDRPDENTSCGFKIIDRAPAGTDASGTRSIDVTDIEAARRALQKELEASVTRPDLHGDALFAAQALNYLGYTSDVSRVFDDAASSVKDELDAASSLQGIADGSVRDARAEAAALRARLSAIEALKKIAFSPAQLSSQGAIGGSYTASTPADSWESFGRFAPGVQAAKSLLRGWTDSSQPSLDAASSVELSLWQRFQRWASSLFNG